MSAVAVTSGTAAPAGRGSAQRAPRPSGRRRRIWPRSGWPWLDRSRSPARHRSSDRSPGRRGDCRWGRSIADIGRMPVAASYSVTPSEKMSVAGPSGSPRACSGDTNSRVPMTMPVDVSACSISSNRRAIPKSASLAFPSAPRSTFDGLTSRWMMPAACAAASAEASWEPSLATADDGIGPSSASRCASEPPVTSSMTRKRFPWSEPASSTATAFGWKNCAAVRDSLSNRRRVRGRRWPPPLRRAT